MTDNKNLTPHVVNYSYHNNPIRFSINGKVMVNATQMAKPFKKAPKDWLRYSPSKEYIETLSKVRKITLTDLVIVNYGGNMPGTWMHEDVALEFARWLSPEFAIWCNDRIKEILIDKQQPQPQPIRKPKANGMKIDTYVSADEKRQLLHLCEIYGFNSTYQVLQFLLRSFLQMDSLSYLQARIKELETENNELKTDKIFWRDSPKHLLEQMK